MYILKKMKTYVHTKTYTPMSTAALFIMAKCVNDPNDPIIQKK
jgi:hypothetical protein